jgi:DNA-binding GntR family transcriptional regulator
MDELNITEKISEVKPLRDMIFDHLKKEILEGRIKPDDRLIERDLAQQLNVSRTPIREALRKLESEGLLSYLPRKGVVVQGFDINEIKEIYDIRKELECLAVRNAIKNITDADIAKMQAILEHVEKDDKVFASQGLNQIDEVILDTAHMPLVKNFLYILKEKLMRYKKLNLSHEPRRKSAIREHRAILAAIIKRDSTLAERLTAEHVEISRQELIKHINLSQ